MNKNVKKIVTLCLYSVALSANTAAMCCLKKNFDSILNKSESSLPSPDDIEEIFGSINSTLQNQNFNDQINTDKKKEVAEILANLLDQESTINPSLIDTNKPNKNRKKRGPTQNEEKYTKLKFSDINTQQKYKKIIRQFPERSQTLVIISCCFANCDSKRSGPFTVARRNMAIHREQQHGIKYHRKKTLNKNIPKLEIEFSSINTQKKYTDTADSLSENDVNDGKQKFVRISCPNCPSTREGKLYRARAGIIYHAKKMHPDLYCE